MDRPTARAALTDAVHRRRETQTADDEARQALEDAIRDGHRAGLTQAEMVTLTRLHRNTVAKIVGDTPRD